MPSIAALRRELAALKAEFAELVEKSLPADQRPLDVLVIGRALSGTPPGVHGSTYYYTGEKPDPEIMTKLMRRLAPNALVIGLGLEHVPMPRGEETHFDEAN